MKHAYLIMAHKNDYTLSTLLGMLDYPNNDIFLHFDAKDNSFDRKAMIALKGLLNQAKLYFTDRICVTWGGYSEIKCELLLLDKAISAGKYDYYHLLSGEDLPIKTHEYIEWFFESNAGSQFLDTCPARSDGDYHDLDRVKYFHFAQEKMGKKKAVELPLLWRSIRKITFVFQDKLNVYRSTKIEFMRGAQWFSITHELADYIVKKKNWIEKTFRWTKCADEMFLQTLIHNTEFEKQVSNLGSLRCVDWKRGMPWIWREDDMDCLIKSDKLFARKFDSSVDKSIIKRIKDSYNKKHIMR